MATIEKIVLQGPNYTVALVLDDVAKTLTGVHGISTGLVPHTFYATFNGTTFTRTLGAGADVLISIPSTPGYTEPVTTRGTGLVVTGLEAYGEAS